MNSLRDSFDVERRPGFNGSESLSMMAMCLEPSRFIWRSHPKGRLLDL